MTIHARCHKCHGMLFTEDLFCEVCDYDWSDMLSSIRRHGVVKASKVA